MARKGAPLSWGEGTLGEAFEKRGHWAQWGEQRQSYWAENICVLFSGREKGHEAKASSKALGFWNLPSCLPQGFWVPGPDYLWLQQPKSPRVQISRLLWPHLRRPGFSTPQTPKPPPESGGTWLKWGSRGYWGRGVIQEGKEQPSAQNWV